MAAFSDVAVAGIFVLYVRIARRRSPPVLKSHALIALNYPRDLVDMIVLSDGSTNSSRGVRSFLTPFRTSAGCWRGARPNSPHGPITSS